MRETIQPIFPDLDVCGFVHGAFGGISCFGIRSVRVKEVCEGVGFLEFCQVWGLLCFPSQTPSKEMILRFIQFAAVVPDMVLVAGISVSLVFKLKLYNCIYLIGVYTGSLIWPLATTISHNTSH